MKTATAPIYYRLKPAIVAPVVVCGVVIALAFVDSPWWLLSIPFAVYASLCAQPNLNLADGCLAYIAIMIGFGIMYFHRPSGSAICFGTLAGFYLSAFEKRLTAKPVHADAALDTTGNPKKEEAESQR
jgi:xanthine/uracil permease